jgi:hypothetical protein
VDVAWQLTWPMSAGASPASATAFSIALIWPAPVGSGR